MAMKNRSRPAVEGVATADRVLSLLTTFRKGDGALSLAELSARTGLVKSTIMRLAVSLEEHGLLVRLRDGSYQLDAEVLRLGAIYQQSFKLEIDTLAGLGLERGSPDPSPEARRLSMSRSPRWSDV